MSDARAVADRMSEAVVNGDVEAIKRCYSPGAVLVAPEGTFKGRDQIGEYFQGWFGPFTELGLETHAKAAWDNRAFDEWSFSATNSGPLRTPSGEEVPATGARVTVRGADVCTVEGGLVVEHHIYYDQAEVLGQLGLIPE